ncbi:MAG: succinate dehydrogenase cytochrome b subunit [Bacteroidetes bacterium]|nr:succinate dehydrogenase cytochrome b subunit [Bacteroidota bacterium]
MSNSALIKSSIAKKYWMALTGLFLCLFLVGHLLGNLQLIFKTGEEGRRAFNEYAYFMGHNIFIKILSYLTYASILFHAIDGILLTIQNRKARPVKYVYSNPSANSSLPSRWMALLGSLILVFIVTHMANFWWKMKVSEEIPLHTYKLKIDERLEQLPDIDYYYTHVPSTYPIPKDTAQIEERGTELYLKSSNLKLADSYRDLHTVVMDFFNPDVNKSAIFYVFIYVISMGVLGFHLWHGFASSFQSLGLNHPKYNKLIKKVGQGFAVIVPFLFAIIPILIFINK